MPAVNTCRCPTPNASPRSTPWPRSARSATRTTTPWPRSVNGLYKTELIRRQGPWRNADHVELATLTYVDWFNQRRLHSELGDIPPAEFEHDHYARIRTRASSPNTHPDLMQKTGRFSHQVRFAASAPQPAHSERPTKRMARQGRVGDPRSALEHLADARGAEDAVLADPDSAVPTREVSATVQLALGRRDGDRSAGRDG